MQHSSRAIERPKRPTRERMDYHTQQQKRATASRGRTWQRTNKRDHHAEQYATQ